MLANVNCVVDWNLCRKMAVLVNLVVCGCGSTSASLNALLGVLGDITWFAFLHSCAGTVVAFAEFA